jgi:S1-C subfamily serine protease
VTGLIQLDADVSAGDSGGPVINRHGQVIGLVEAEYPDDKGLNYATSAKTAGPLITAWTSSPQVATTTCPTPDGRVEVKSRHPDAPGIAVSVLHYLIGINFGNHPATASGTTGYQLAYAVLSGQMKAKYQSLTDFENAQEGNVFSDVVVEKAAWKSDVKDTVDVSYRLTHTDPGESTATCEIDHVEYVVRLDSGVWTFDEVKELGVPASPKTC